MPTILAIDTSTDACSIALMTDEQTIVESSIVAAREHTQRILPMVAELLQVQAVGLQDIDAIAFGCGPGSFTGLRICISIAQGLAYGADIPLIPVSNLQAMAQAIIRSQLAEQGSAKLDDRACIAPVLDARMDEVYYSAYSVIENTGSYSLQPMLAERVCSPDDCYRALSGLNLSAIYPAGSGWEYTILKNMPLGQNIISQLDKPIYMSAIDIAALAWQEYKHGKVINAIDAEPTYLRNEVAWKKRTRLRERTLKHSC